MALRLITSPAAEPVSLSEAKAHLRVTSSSENDLIAIYLAAARQMIDGPTGWLGRALVTQTWELLLDTFPANEIKIPLPPLQSITSIKYDDEEGVEQTIGAENYDVDLDGWIVTADDYAWPTPIAAINAVRVRFVAGYGNAAAVPSTVKAAIMLMVGDMHRHRASVSDGSVGAVPMSTTVESILAGLRVWSL